MKPKKTAWQRHRAAKQKAWQTYRDLLRRRWRHGLRAELKRLRENNEADRPVARHQRDREALCEMNGYEAALDGVEDFLAKRSAK